MTQGGAMSKGGGVSLENFQQQLAQLTAATPQQGTGSPYLDALAAFRSSSVPRTPGIGTIIAGAAQQLAGSLFQPSGPSPSGLQGDTQVIVDKLFGGYVTNGLGQYFYSNGVLADPTQNTVTYPTPDSGIDPKTVAGSPQWLLEIQSKWDEKKANKWRKDLANLGYQISESGGMAQDLIEGLRQYHASRYLNGGKPIPLQPTGSDPEAIRKSIDFVALKETAKSWGQVPFGEDLDPRTAEYFADRVLQIATELAQKHKEWAPEQIVSGAEVRAQKEFLNDPNVSGAIEENEDDEMDESLKNDIVSIAQIATIR